MNLFVEYSIVQIFEKLKKKQISFKDILNQIKKNIKSKEKKYHAWNEINLKSIELSYKKFDDQLKKNNFIFKHKKLFGIPFGVKDIFNTNNFKTEMGSVIWKNFFPGNNARVVDKLINEGCLSIGKTVTAEFAVHELNKTLNPYDVTKTPGTSSSGSAVVVSTGMVPFALGTQTAGSIIRPASFCGVWGMKPSYGLIPRTGVLKTSDTLDTIGFLTSRVDNLEVILNSMIVSGQNYPLIQNNLLKKSTKKKLNIGFLETDLCNDAVNILKENKDKLKRELNKRHITKKISWPINLKNINEIHEIIYNKNLSYYFKNEYKKKGFKISKIMRKMIIDGDRISSRKYLDALDKQIYIIRTVNKLIAGFDIVFTTSTSSSAVNRGDKEIPDPSLIWTLSHIPSVNVPFILDESKMPIGIQAIAKKWSDFQLINSLNILSDQKYFKKKINVI